ncbi:MAG: ABC transporter permease, partial [Oscillospiraceae bacterium]
MPWNRVWEHLMLVVIGSSCTIAVGLFLGILAYLVPKISKVILWTVDVLQTVPSLATLGILMVIFGGGKTTVIIGMVLYSLLPIVRNTYVALTGVSPAIKEAACGMGMGRLHRLVLVEFPVAFPIIFTGIRISTVTSIGVAVFGTFVGGGGLGDTLYRGIYVQNMQLILFGTAALMVM